MEESPKNKPTPVQVDYAFEIKLRTEEIHRLEGEIRLFQFLLAKHATTEIPLEELEQPISLEKK